MLPADRGRVISGGSVHARLLAAHDHPAYASTFEMQVAPGFDVGAHVHSNGDEMFFVLEGEPDMLCFKPFFQSSVQGGRENYFTELGELLQESQGRPGPSAVCDLEAKYGTEQITAMLTG